MANVRMTVVCMYVCTDGWMDGWQMDERRVMANVRKADVCMDGRLMDVLGNINHLRCVVIIQKV